MPDSDGIGKLIRSHLKNFTGYSASVSPETLEGKIDAPIENIIKLNANENIYGCSPKVIKALAECSHFHIYPDDGQQELRKSISLYAGVDSERVVAGHGSNTLIDFIVRLFVGPGDEVITCVPTFDIYRFSTELCGGTVIDITRDENFAINIQDVKASVNNKTKLIFLASPNNPTGNIIPQRDIVEIIETGMPVVVDEAYYEYCGETIMPLVNRYDNLIVLRSFSKWAGLAGLRVGYGVFPTQIAKYMMAIKIPHNVSYAAEVAVRASLEDLDYLHDRVKAIIVERSRLYEELKKISWLIPYPSQANFIYCAVVGRSAEELYQDLQRKGILIRYFDKPLLKNSVRISIGKPEHTDTLLKALREL